jgi:hypothetical protein
MERYHEPFTWIRAVINIYGAHIDAFLMPTSPASLNFEIELRSAAARNVLVKVGQQVKLLLISQERAIDFLP